MKLTFILAVLLTQFAFAGSVESHNKSSFISPSSTEAELPQKAPGETTINPDETIVDLSKAQRLPTQVIDTKDLSVNEALLEAQMNHSFNQKAMDKEFAELDLN